MPCHSLSHLITPYPLGWKQNHFHLVTLKLVPRSLISYHNLPCLVTPYHTLLHLITPYPLGWKQNHFHFTFGNFKFSSQAPNCLSQFITPYPQGWKQSQFHLVTLELVPSPLISYHILSFRVTTYHNLSHLIP